VSLAWHYFREQRFLMVGYTLLLTLNMLAGALYWPEMRDNFPEMIKFIPFEPLQQFVRAFEQHGFWAYFCVQHFFKGAGMFGIAAAGLMGTGIVAREVDRRTAELLLSRPISRARILFVRWATGAVMLFVPFIAVAFATIPLAASVDETLNPWFLLQGTLYSYLFILVAFTATMALSTRFSHYLKAGMLVLGFLLMNLAIYMIQDLWDYSLYNIIDLDLVMPIADGYFPWYEAAWMGTITLLLYSLGLWGFRRRDF
jgi:ABC-type transport system involved in multi-copper enzyme maturation permease subunit